MITRARLKMQMTMACTGALLIIGSGTGLHMASAHPAAASRQSAAPAEAPAAASTLSSASTPPNPPNGRHCDANSDDPPADHPDCDNDHDGDTNGHEGHCDNGNQAPDADDNNCPPDNDDVNGQCAHDGDHDADDTPLKEGGNCPNPPPPPPDCSGPNPPASCPPPPNCSGPNPPASCPPPADTHPCDTHGIQGTDKATIADTLYEGGLKAIPIIKNPVPNGPISGALDKAAGAGDATSSTNQVGPLAPVVHEVACVVSLVDENISGG